MQELEPVIVRNSTENVETVEHILLNDIKGKNTSYCQILGLRLPKYCCFCLKDRYYGI